MEEITVSSIVARAINPPPLSLTDYCVIKVTTLILEDDYINKLLKLCKCGAYVDKTLVFRMRKWNRLLAKINDMLKDLKIPTTLEEKILHNLWPLASNKLRWMTAYARDLDRKHLQDFTWTDRGKIDNLKTVRTLIRNSSFAIKIRFELACLFFLDNEIIELWNEMSEDEKSPFYTEDAHPMVMYFLQCQANSIELSGWLFKHFLKYKIPWEAFKDAFSEEDMWFMAWGYLKFLSDALVNQYFYEEEITYTCLFLLSQLDDKYKTKFFNKHPSLLLCCILDYINLAEFRAFYQQSTYYIDQKKICEIFSFLFHKFYLGGRQYLKCGNFIMELLMMIPDVDKKYLKREGHGLFWGANLIKIHFPIVLKEGGYLEIERLIPEQSETNATERLLQFKRDMWHLLEFLIEVKLITVRIMKNHKENLMALFDLSETDEDKWNNAISFIERMSKKCSRKRKKRKQDQNIDLTFN